MAREASTGTTVVAVATLLAISDRKTTTVAMQITRTQVGRFSRPCPWAAT